MVTHAPGTYVYCLVASRLPPPLTRKRSGLPGTGKPRLLDLFDDRASPPHAHGESPRSRVTSRRRPRTPSGAWSSRALGRWLVVADAPLDRYGEEAINRGLADLDWVARAAVAHEAVVESFVSAPAVLPMKLFTIFTSDARARDHIRLAGRRIDRLIEQVANHQEWGVRVMFNPPVRAAETRGAERPTSGGLSGKRYLMRKKAEREAAGELARHARDTVAGLYDRLAQRSDFARRRKSGELPARVQPPLLDAVFLVGVRQSTRFCRLVAREARALLRHGYQVTLTGPWPPYSFVED
jgi:hypothetical protein